MEKFITEDFLLSSDTAKRLYQNYAKDAKIVDYHCHLSPREIYEDIRFETITDVWLLGDHYKWRLLRANGAAERLVTGNADKKEKFSAFAAMLPRAIGNPMYHWCHLELKKYFDFDGVLDEKSADYVWEHCNNVLKNPDFSARSLIKKSGVRFIGTTDDPTDSLEWHKKIRSDKSFDCTVAPSFRPDKALNIEKEDWLSYIKKLEEAEGVEISSIDSLEAALENRMKYFDENGCRASDHGLDYVPCVFLEREKINEIFKKALGGGSTTKEESEAFKTHLILFCASCYKKLGWVMQWHYNCMRNPNSLMFKKLGADSGFDIPAAKDCVGDVVSLLNRLYETESLPKTVLYSLNPHENLHLAAAAGSFQGEGVRSKIQHGSAWWFNDTKDGMEAQIKTLASVGLLANFVGMLTDSRSFLSYARHDYFRRILCGIIGKWMDDGEYPRDEERAGKIVADICFNNAKEYLGL